MQFPYLDETMPAGIITGMMGRKQSGKSLYALELAYQIKRETGKDTLYISSEESSHYFQDLWAPSLEVKYNTKLTLHYKYVPMPLDLLRLVGISGNLMMTKHTPKKVEENEEQETKVKATKAEFVPISVAPETSPLLDFIRENNIGLIVIDSITAAFDILLMGGQQNFPLRQALEEAFFIYLMKVVELTKEQIYIFTTHHLSMNPTVPFQTITSAVVKGGSAVGHHVKVLFAIERSNDFLNILKQTKTIKKEEREVTIPFPTGARNIWVLRYPTIQEWSKVYLLQIDSNGFRRSSEEERATLKRELASRRQLVTANDVARPDIDVQ